MKQHELVDVAHRIAHRIAAEAEWQGEACTWQVQELVAETGHGRKQAANGSIYQGSAGIALFLGETFAVTADRSLAAAAAGGLEHALAWGRALPPWSYSFHAGRLGIGWVALRLAALLERPELRDRALEILAPLPGHETQDHGLDVISGGAGAIPVLLGLAEELGREDLVEVARRLGDHLVEAALKAPGGWSWDTVGPVAVRHLTGLAHGASGFALALLELARATGEGRFRFAAEMAFLYERRAFDPTRGNWPDLRHITLSHLYHQGGDDAVRDAARAGEIPEFAPAYASAWCHGAPGVGLARLRAWELTGEDLYREEAELALAATLPGMDKPLENTFCLCHGLGGNSELLLEAARLGVGGDALLDRCHRCAEVGRASFEDAGRPWPCGTVDAVPDPSLMVGEAGIGHFFLRLADVGTTSILLPRPPRVAAAARPAEDDGFAALAAEWVEERFAQSRAVFALHGRPWPAAAGHAAGPLRRSPLEEAHEALREHLAGPLPPAVRRDLDDAFSLDRLRHEMAAVAPDLAAEGVAALVRPAVDDLDWTAVRFTRADALRRHTTRRDWHDAPAESPSDGGVEWMLRFHGGEVEIRRLGTWPALVLDALERPATVAELADRLAERLEGADRFAAGLLHRRAEEQLRELFRAGMVDVAAAPAAAGRRAS